MKGCTNVLNKNFFILSECTNLRTPYLYYESVGGCRLWRCVPRKKAFRSLSHIKRKLCTIWRIALLLLRSSACYFRSLSLTAHTYAESAHTHRDDEVLTHNPFCSNLLSLGAVATAGGNAFSSRSAFYYHRVAANSLGVCAIQSAVRWARLPIIQSNHARQSQIEKCACDDIMLTAASYS